MVEVLSGIMLVALATGTVYLIDYAASRSKSSGGARAILVVVAGLLILSGLGALGIRVVSDRPVGALATGVLSAGLVLVAVLPLRGRQVIARILPLDPWTPRDWVGLVIILWLVILRLVTFSDGSESEFGEISVSAAAIQTFVLLGAAVASIGLFFRRDWREAVGRLGLDRLSNRAVTIGALSVVPVVIMSALTVLLVEYISPGTTDRLGETINEITGGETSLGYGLAIGISAAAGEETLFRGAIQPKYGLIFTSLVFAILHAQYDLLLIVASLFPLGLIFGLERKYFGTFACIITHALYNTLAVVAG